MSRKPPPKPTTDGEIPPPQKSKAHQQAQQIRWALTKANESEVVDLVNAMPTSESLPLLDMMRKNVEAAARAIQLKIDATRDRQICEFCKGPRKGRQWRMIRPIRHEVTRHLENHFWCSDICVALWNQKQQGGIAALSDRGGKFGKDMPVRT